MAEKKPAMKVPAAKRGRDVTRSERQEGYLQRLEGAKGKRLVVDLDAPAREALEALVGTAYGKTQADVVRKALTQAAQRKCKKA